MQYNLETGGYNAKAERDERSFVNQGHRRVFRYQVQGPNAAQVMEKVTGKARCRISASSRWTSLKIAGLEIRALRHGMTGQPGWEMYGPWERGDEVRDAIVTAGKEFGIRQVGARAYPTTCLESGWIPSPRSGGLRRRRDEGIPAVVDRKELRGHGFTRRQLLLR